jgi:CBS domain containing-hemolysin-like protein
MVKIKPFVVMNEGKACWNIKPPRNYKSTWANKERMLPIASAMDKDLLYLDAELSLESALKELQRSKKHLALVSFQNTLLGAVDIQNVTEFLLIRSAKQK